MPNILIVGAGPGGLYTAWRFLTATTGNNVTVCEMSPARIGGRIHTKSFKAGNYVDLGGMRFSNAQKIINKVIPSIGLNPNVDVKDFVEVNSRLMSLRGRPVYSTEIDNVNPVPYNTPFNKVVVDDLFNDLAQAVVKNSAPNSRAAWCAWIENAKLPSNVSTGVYDLDAPVTNIGYWNLLYDYLGNEGYHYAADAGGYESNVINWNAADAIPYNGEFGADVKYLRFNGGYTKFINALYKNVIANNRNSNPVKLNQRLISFDYNSGTKQIDAVFEQTTAPGGPTQTYSADFLFLCMPRRSVDLIARSAYFNTLARQLNNTQVKLYTESVIEQPSYKIGVSCNTRWWTTCDYKPRLNDPPNAWGPTVTDLPLRQIYYFDPEDGVQPNSYAILASYDDERYTGFWQQFEIESNSYRTIPTSENYESLNVGAPLTKEMTRMLALQLAQVHYAPKNVAAGYQTILKSITEGYYMDWSLNPFGGGYHAWAAHYKLCDVMQKIRRPLMVMQPSPTGADKVYLVGSAYSNDQAWVEGAFCTAESALVQFFNVKPIVDITSYPLICQCVT